MIAKTAEGLLGTNNAMNVVQTSLKVFREARARGDRATMDRAMGYVKKVMMKLGRANIVPTTV